MRRVLYILSLILLIAVQSQAQSARTSPVDGTQDKIIKLYPNPAQSFITFDLQNNYRPGLSVHVYNGLLGKRMFENQNIREKFTLNLTDFTRGVYIYHLIDAKGKIIESGKFQVSR